MILDLEEIDPALAQPGVHPWVIPTAFHPGNELLLAACGSWLLEVDLRARAVVQRWSTLSETESEFGLNDVFLREAFYAAGGRLVVAHLGMDMGEVEYGYVSVFERGREAALATRHDPAREHGDAPDERGVLAVALAPTAEALAVGVAEAGVEVWDLRAPAGAPARSFATEGAPRALGYAPDGAALAVWTGATLELRDAATGAALARGVLPGPDAEDAVRHARVCFAPDGAVLALVERLRRGSRVRVFRRAGAQLAQVRDAFRRGLEPLGGGASAGLVWKRVGTSARDTGAALLLRREGLTADARPRRLGASAGVRDVLARAFGSARGHEGGSVVFPVFAAVSPDGTHVARAAGRRIVVTRVARRAARAEPAAHDARVIAPAG
jgi:hypothetical protein